METDRCVQARSRPRMAVNNENDENQGRVTRAKAAALTDYDLAKKPLQTKKSTTNALGNAAQRRRAALGDVTNATKGVEPSAGDGKKSGNGKPGLASKAAPAGVQKLTRTNSSRSALGLKDNNAKPKPATTELKRQASGSGVLGNIQKKRSQSSTSNIPSSKEATPNVDEPPRKKSCSESEIKSTKAEAQILEDVKTTVQAFQDAVTDLDAEDLDDPLMVAEYVQEIFEYYKQLEETTMPNPEYMEHQDDLDWSMRGVLVDWLIEVHTRFRLLPETLFLAVNIVDRFLSSKVVPLDKFQLVGVTAMFIASKYEEVLSPHIGNFVHVADNGFTVDEVLAAERYTLTALKYDLSYPNPMNFLRRISKADNYDIQTRTIGKYLMEISLLDHRFMPYRQSHIAAAAMYLSRLILERGPWVRRYLVLVEKSLIQYPGRDSGTLFWIHRRGDPTYL
jgi:G2/mitotic-specific cyclin 2